MTEKSRLVVVAVLVVAVVACGGSQSTPDETAPVPATTSSDPTTVSEPDTSGELNPGTSVPTSEGIGASADTSEPLVDANPTVTSTTLTWPKSSVPASAPPAEAASVIAAAVADLSERLGVSGEEILVLEAGFGSAPADNPCEPGVLDRRDSETPLLSIIEVTLRHDGVGYRYVEADGELLACESIAGG